MRSTLRLAPRLLLLLMTVLLLLAGTARAAQTAPVASFSSAQSTVAPLQPVLVNVHVQGFSGPATLLVFDPQHRIVGSWDLTVQNDYGAVSVTPRGGLGPHWAALFASGQQVASGTLYTLDAQTTVQTGVPYLDGLYPTVHSMMDKDVLSYALDGQSVRGYRSGDSALLWLRDHVYQGRGFRYFEPDVKSLLDAFRRDQQPDGSLFDVISRPDYEVNGFRTPVEADVEYLYVQGVYDAWRMNGDDAWLQQNLPSMQRAISYTLTSPTRWEPWLKLVKRPYTIDTWDFEYGPETINPTTGKPAPRHWIDDQTRWGIFHGDNTGLAQALNSLASVEDYLGQPQFAQFYRETATGIMQRLNNLSWNGSFYRHHVPLKPFVAPGVDEAKQLSLSNALALNRGVLTLEQRRAILNEYQSRLRSRDNVSFAEWWSIDPPFPGGSFGLAGKLGERPGEYVNGGIMPLVGGELSRGAFDSGMETYGFDILRRYTDVISKTGGSFLWYYPTGGAGIGTGETIPTDGWGASAMLGGLMEGAAGVVDNGVRYSDVTLSPRWPGAPETVNTAYVVTRYAASDGYAAYRWSRTPDSLSLDATGSGERMHLRLLLPFHVLDAVRVTLNGQPVQPQIELVGDSRYVTLNVPNGIVQVQVSWK